MLNNSAEIQSLYCSCLTDLAETCDHVSAIMFQQETAVCNGFVNPFCTISASKWLPCRKDHEPNLFGYVYILKQKIKMLQIWI